MNPRRYLNLFLREAGIGMALAVLCIIFAIGAPNFASTANVTNIFTQISINTVVSVGMTFAILLAGIDLSVGSVVSLATILAGKVITANGLNTPTAIILAVLAALAAGMACGFFNGFVSERWKMPAFITTLGMMNIARGAALQISESRTIYSFPPAFNAFGAHTYFGIPSIFIMAMATVVLGWFILTRTVFGRMIYAIGNNEEAVRLSGHNPSSYKVLAYVFCGAMVGVAAIMYMLRLNVASPILGVGFELKAIAAVVVGGTSMNGGKGSIIGTFLGACIIGVLDNGLLLMGMGDFVRQMITGLIIVVAVIIDSYRARITLSVEA
ncbi:MAG: ABC transporter permease [Anaerolineaceae bacterium]|nr:ABC transporter permease [Anaerolineaceae bacterium]